ncbi:hypothetical protein MN608_08297 [Microdochium nivale]|nr:hypothetical protein MN608_08297 [Microdochium nivale]
MWHCRFRTHDFPLSLSQARLQSVRPALSLSVSTKALQLLDLQWDLAATVFELRTDGSPTSEIVAVPDHSRETPVSSYPPSFYTLRAVKIEFTAARIRFKPNGCSPRDFFVCISSVRTSKRALPACCICSRDSSLSPFTCIRTRPRKHQGTLSCPFITLH